MNNTRYLRYILTLVLTAGLVFGTGAGSALADNDTKTESGQGTVSDSPANAVSSDNVSNETKQNTEQGTQSGSSENRTGSASGNSAESSGSGSGQNTQNTQNSQSGQSTQNNSSSDKTSGSQTPAAPEVPKIYAATGVSSTVTLKPSEATDVLAVGTHLMTDLNAAVVASDGTNMTNEVWEHAVVPNIVWVPMPAGYDPANPGPYSFLWTGVVPKGSVIYSDTKMTRAAAVAADIPVVVTFNITNAAGAKTTAVSGNAAEGAPRTGDDFKPGIWVYLMIIGGVVSLCSLVLYRDLGRN